MMFSLRKAIDFTQSPRGGIQSGVLRSAVGHLWCYMKTGVIQNPYTGVLSWAPNIELPLLPGPLGAQVFGALDAPPTALSLSRQFAVLATNTLEGGDLGLQYGAFEQAVDGSWGPAWFDLVVHLVSPLAPFVQTNSVTATELVPDNQQAFQDIIDVMHAARLLFESSALVGFRNIRWTIDTFDSDYYNQLVSDKSVLKSMISLNNDRSGYGAVNLYFVSHWFGDIRRTPVGSALGLTGNWIFGPDVHNCPPDDSIFVMEASAVGVYDAFGSALFSSATVSATDPVTYAAEVVVHELGHYFGLDHFEDTGSCTAGNFDGNIMHSSPARPPNSSVFDPTFGRSFDSGSVQLLRSSPCIHNTGSPF